MDNASQKLLESAAQRTLHASGFARSSSQASLVLTDLLSRYLHLLTSTCTKYAQHSGRTRLSPLDAISALDELGMSLEELKDFGQTEGLELNRYALKSARRAEDLHEFRVQLVDGLKQDHDDVIPLHYALYEGPEGLEEETDDDDDDLSVNGDAETRADADAMYVDADAPTDESRNPRAILPLSPISNPSSPPPRKRQRVWDWQPPDHVPHFLPPFPSMDDVPSSPVPELPEPTVRPPSPTQPALPAQALTSSATADWLLQVPYHQSSLSGQSEFHLPGIPLDPPEKVQKLPTPLIEPSLLSAYHHVLTNRQSASSVGTSNPLRHKVAMSLLTLAQSSSRWEPADTLYSNLATNQPRVTALGPSHAVPIGKDKKDFKFPSISSRSVIVSDRLSTVVSQQSSRIPELAKQVLPAKIFNRASKMGPPPVLIADGNPLTYGAPVPAPWNVSAPVPGDKKDKDKDEPAVLPNALLYATWDSEPKHYAEPLKVKGPRTKAVLSSRRR